jgi:D-arabinose 1-dehydrogenase-like Zn-dependent alcohol dehydrogenase
LSATSITLGTASKIAVWFIRHPILPVSGFLGLDLLEFINMLERRSRRYTGNRRLGHLGVQFAAKMGFKTVAIGRGKDEEELVRNLDAMQYIDSRSQNVDEELKLGGAKIVLTTVPSGKAMSGVLGGLAVNRRLIVIGASDEPIELPPNWLLSGRRSIVG